MTTPTPTPTPSRSRSRFTGEMSEETAEKIVDEEQPAPPIKRITAAFNTAAGRWDRDQNLFFRLSTFNDAEFTRYNANKDLGFQRAEYRQMMTGDTSASQGPLTAQEIADIRQIHQDALAAVGRHRGMDINAAETLVFAAKAAHVQDVAGFVDGLVAKDGNILDLKAGTVTKAGPFKFDVNSWLYMVKKHGNEHGLGWFADQINLVENKDAAGNVVSASVEVSDPAVLRQIVSMRNNPRLSSVMGAHAFNEGEPPNLSYRGATYSTNPQVLQDQQALLALGFDIGNRRADGMNGPLTSAAFRDFMHMRAITDPAEASRTLQSAVEEARKTAGIYAYDAGKKAWVRYPLDDRRAAAMPGAVKLDIKDAFALKIANERSGVKFSELLNIVIAERAFDKAGANPNREPGLFHMSKGAWLATVAEHGQKYGLGDLVKQMEIDRDPSGKITNVTIRNPMVRKYILDLRLDPRVSAVMGGERALNGPIHLDIAEAWLGKSENANKAELQQFFRTFGGIGHNPSSREAGDASAWCAVFVNTLMDATGRQKTDSLTMARSFVNEDYGTKVLTAAEVANANKGRPAERRRKMDELASRVQPGDIVVVPRGDSAVFGHVTIVQDIYKDAKGEWRLKVIGGNQGSADGGSVTVSTGYTLSDVIGIRRAPPVSQSTLVERPTPDRTRTVSNNRVPAPG